MHLCSEKNSNLLQSSCIYSKSIHSRICNEHPPNMNGSKVFGLEWIRQWYRAKQFPAMGTHVGTHWRDFTKVPSLTYSGPSLLWCKITDGFSMAVHYLVIWMVGQKRGYFFYHHRKEKALWHIRGFDLVHTQIGRVTQTRSHYCRSAMTPDCIQGVGGGG